MKDQYQKYVCFLLSRANKSFKLVYLSVIRFMLNIFALALILERTNTTNMPFSSSKARLLLTLMQVLLVNKNIQRTYIEDIIGYLKFKYQFTKPVLHMNTKQYLMSKKILQRKMIASVFSNIILIFIIYFFAHPWR